MRLSTEELTQLRREGYTDADIAQALKEDALEQAGGTSELQQSYHQAINQNIDPRAGASTSMFGRSDQENLIKWQLELDTILQRVEHMLRGDKIKFEKGSIIWTRPKGKEGVILNDFGVSEVMRILSMYLNRNTILSNYDEDTINYKVFDFGMEIADLFFLKYEDMGLDSLQTRKLYPILIRQLVDIVHSAYLRALHGGERDSLRENRQVTQSENLTPNGMVGMGGMPPARPRGVLNPLRYFTGKFK